jgi:hypothetical protein
MVVQPGMDLPSSSKGRLASFLLPDIGAAATGREAQKPMATREVDFSVSGEPE